MAKSAETKFRTIEDEIISAVGVMEADRTDRAAFVAALLKGISLLPDPKWEDLSEDTQEWYNENIKRRNTNKANPKNTPLLFLDPATGKEVAGSSEDKPQTKGKAAPATRAPVEDTPPPDAQEEPSKGRGKGQGKRKAAAPKADKVEQSKVVKPKVEKPIGAGNKARVKDFLIKDEALTVKDLEQLCVEHSIPLKKGTLIIIRGDTLQTLGLLRAAGKLKG